MIVCLETEGSCEEKKKSHAHTLPLAAAAVEDVIVGGDYRRAVAALCWVVDYRRAVAAVCWVVVVFVIAAAVLAKLLTHEPNQIRLEKTQQLDQPIDL